MQRALKYLRSEFAHVRQDHMLLISLVAILFVPIMYGGFFLGSVWDPYGNTKHLPVAVVNNDQPTVMDGKPIHIGADVVDALKHNDAMGWKFMSNADADKELSDGTIYMKIVIPEATSRNATTISDAHPTQTTFHYTTIPARNYVSSLLTKQAAETATRTASEQITKAYVATIMNQLGSLQGGLVQAANGANQLARGSASLQSGIDRYTAGVDSLASGQQQLSRGLSGIASGSSSLEQGATTLTQSLPTQAQIAQLTGGVTSIQSGINQLHASVASPDPNLIALQTTVQTNANSLAQSLHAYQTTIVGAQSSIAALTDAAQSGAPSATVSTADIAKTLSVVSTSQTVASDSATLLTNLSQLTTALNAQQSALLNATTNLNSGINQLAPNLNAALGGYQAVASGSSQLASGAAQLHTGALGAANGSSELLGGTQQLQANSTALSSGATNLASGSGELAGSLSTAANQIALQPTGDDTVKQIVSPLANSGSSIGHVPNYGYALSPYVLSLGLFIGALVFTVIYPVRRYITKPSSAFSWWLGKLSIAALVAIGQALVLCLIMIAGLGLHPDHLGQFILMACITSLTYMSIICCLVITLDNVGRFLAMLLLVVQLGSAAGVFPIVLSSGFFQAMNPLVPMTYSITAFREAISSGIGTNQYWGSMLVLIGFGLIANLIVLVFLRIHGMRHFRHETVEA